MKAILFFAASALTVPAAAQDRGPDPARLKRTVETLVGFGTRHSLSGASDPNRGIGAARAWATAEFARIGKACGGCLKVEPVSEHFTAPRAPNGVDIVDLLAIQPGTGDPNQVVIVAAHIDSRASDVMNPDSDAPGANDNGSGSALVLEAARILSTSKFDGTIVYALLSGEEQGLLGGKLLASTAKARGWQVRAMLNNDIVGSTVGQNGQVVADRVRVFSEGIRAAEDNGAAQARRKIGAEDDGPSRAVAKKIVAVGKANAGIGLDVFAVRRPDRFGRGGDHSPSLDLGYPAVRFTVGIENYDRQHQNPRVEGGREYGDTVAAMDFAYLAKVTALNVATLRELATAPAAPTDVTLDGALSMDTTVRWSAVPGAKAYHIYHRRADAQDWVAGPVITEGTMATLRNVVVDDTFIGVASVGPSGAESTISFGGIAAPR
ncbi:M20/M25/M40 family metallo-hydrolase [soil metagenome]